MRIVLADDHTMVRQGFRAILEHHLVCTIIGEAATGTEAMTSITHLQPDVALVDLMLPEATGIAVTRHVKAITPHVAILIVSMYGDLGYVDAAMQAGASGYVLKEADAMELVTAVQTVAAGRRILSSHLEGYWHMPSLRPNNTIPIDPYDLLTARERDVFAGAMQGNTSVQIAAHLCLSVRTVEAYRASMLRKLGLRTQTDLICFAVRTGRMPVVTNPPIHDERME